MQSTKGRLISNILTVGVDPGMAANYTLYTAGMVSLDSELAVERLYSLVHETLLIKSDCLRRS